MSKIPPGGNLGGHNSSAEDPYRPRSFGKAPRVGQAGKPYGNENAHNVTQKRTGTPEPGGNSGTSAASRPHQKGYGA